MASPPRFFGFLRARLGRRIVFLFFACALIPIGVFAAVSFVHVRGQLAEQRRERLRSLAKEVTQSIVERLHWAELDLERAAAELSKGEMGAPEPRPSPEPLGSRSGWASSIRLVRGAGEARRVLSGPGETGIADSAVLAHLAAGKAVIRVQRGEADVSALIARAVDPARPAAGLLVARIEPGYLHRQIHPWSDREGTADATLPRAYSTLPAMVELCIVTPAGPLSGCPEAVVQALAGASSPSGAEPGGSWGHFAWKDGERGYLASRRTLFLQHSFGAPNWAILLSEPDETALAPIAGFQRTFLLAILLVMLVVPFLSQVQIRRNLEPLEKLQDGTRRIAGQEFDSRVSIESGDEFEELASSFNTMAERLGRQFGALLTANEIDRAILGSVDTPRIVETVLRRSPEVLPGALISIVVWDEEGNAALWTEEGRIPLDFALAGLPEEEIRALRATPDGLVLTAESSLCRHLSEDGRGGRPIAFPVLVDGDLRGAFLMGRPDGAPGEEDRAHARQLADRMAVALANAGLVEELGRFNLETITAFARAIDAKSAWTAGHSERVTEMALRLGAERGLTTEELDVLRRGALLHDVGKIGVPGAILDKPGKLTDEEMDQMRAHTVIGARILEPISRFEPIVPIARQHHERFDGGGYPDGLAGEAIHPLARIVCVADVYDALISARPYRAARPRAEVVEFILSQSGSMFDPAIVEAFTRVMRRQDEAEDRAATPAPAGPEPALAAVGERT